MESTVKRLAASAMCAAMFGVGAAFAEDMPFWGEGSPSTNRVAAVDRHHGMPSFSSFVCDARTHVFARFKSTKPSLVIIVF